MSAIFTPKYDFSLFGPYTDHENLCAFHDKPAEKIIGL